MKTLKETIEELPAPKAIKFIEIFFDEYIKHEQKLIKKPFVLSKYREGEYVKLLRKSLTEEQLRNQVKLRIPRTSFGTMTTLMGIAQELGKLIKK